jgi:hypothetical protein
MPAIDGLGDSEFKTFGFRVIDKHARPGGGLQNRPMSSRQLKYDPDTKKLQTGISSGFDGNNGSDMF